MKSFVISFALIFISCLGFAQTRQYLLAGQSNARGIGVAALSPTVDPLVSFEYHPILDSLIQLQDPVGVDAGGFQQAWTGSAWPAFAQTYYDLTGDTTAMIQAARGGSGVHPISASAGVNWSANGLLYDLCKFKIDQAIAYTGLPLDGVVWVQGEQDAARINFGAYEQDGYRDALVALIDRFREDYGCGLPFYMVLLGANTEDPVEGYDAVRAAQVEVAAIHPHTYLIHENAVNFPELGWMLDNVHYTQDGYNEIGTVGAQNMIDIEDTYYTITKNTSATDTICRGDSVMLSAPPMYTDYQWSNGDTGQNIFVTEGGEYSVMVTDNSGCTFALHAINVVAYPDQIRPVISLSANDTLCVGDEVTLTSSISSTQNYLWSNGATTPSITVNTTGDFFVQTIDIYGCLSEPSDTISTAVISLSQPMITLSGPTDICDGESVTLSAPPGFDNYSWSNGEITQSITVTASGSFSCIVRLADCVSESSTSITVSVAPSPPAPTITANGQVTFCEGESVALTASNEFSRYLWSTGDTTQSITVYNSGTYSCSFVGDNDCVGPEATPIVVVQNSLPTTPSISVSGSTELCEGDEITLTAPSGFSTYQWSTGEATPSITVNSAGTFDVMVTNLNSCQSQPSASITTTVNPLPPAPMITTDGPTTFCEGDSVTLSAPGGFSDYLWSNGDTTQSIIVYDSNSYSCIVTDANGCVSPISTPIVVTEIAAPAIPMVSASGSLTFCEGDSVTLTAPAGFFDYQWSNGASTQSITIYDSGTFDVIVTDINGCQSEASVPLTVTSISSTIPPIVMVSDSTTFCAGESVTLTAPIGSSYLWSNSEITQSIDITTSGTYTCIITSADGCETPPSEPVTVTVNPLPPTPTITSDNSTTFCEGDSVTLTASAGFSDYLWSNGDSTQSITVSTSGIFSVFVTDANGCSSPVSEPVTTTSNLLPTINVTTIGTTTFCEGDSVVLIASSGFTDYLWSNGEMGQTIIVTDSGTFDVVGTDVNDCESMPSAPITTIAISPVSPPVITANGDTNLCEGQTVTLSAPAGFTNYLWSTGEITQDITVSDSGTYTCMITGIDDCESPPSEPIEVTVHPLPPTPSITSNNSNTFCEGDSITLTASGGFTNYLWSNGADTQSITVTGSGIFAVMAVDDNGCESPLSQSVSTNVITIPTPSITAQGPTVFCHGDSVILTAPAGFANYLWSNGEMTQSVVITDSDTLEVIVGDDSGCLSMPSASVEVGVFLAAFAPVITANGSTNLCEGESVTLSATSGFTEYLWSTGAITQDITVNVSGSYSCIVTNVAGCESLPSFPVDVVVNPLPDVPIITSSGDLSFCEGESVTLSAPAGFDSYLWSNGEITQSITVTDSGTFDVVVTDADGCESPASASTTIQVNSVATPTITASGPITFCEGESVTLSAPAGFDSYSWSNGEITQSITVTDSGTFDVVVTDADGCESPNSIPVTVNALSVSTAPILTTSGPTTFCEGESVTISAPGGFQNYSWSTGEITQSIVVSASGTFVCEIISNNGCPSPPSDPIEVEVNPLPDAPTITASDATTFCEGDNITLSAPSGFDIYQWSNGEITQNITVTESGTYDLIVTDTNGCESPVSNTITTIVNPIAAPTITANGELTFCEGESVTLSAPAGFVDYLWSNGEITQSIIVTDSDTFDVIVTDSNNCTSPASESVNVVVLSLSAPPEIMVSGSTSICEGESVTLSAPAGLSGYQWSTNETTQSIIVTTAGTYTCEIVDDNDCVSPASEPVTITVNPLPATPTIIASGATTFCEGESVTLSAPNGFQAYEWSTGEITQSITVDQSGNYDVFVTDDNECVSPNSQETTVTVNELPVASPIIASGATTFCDGDSVVLSAPSGFQTYEWSTGEITQNITVYQSGIYDYFVIDGNDCISANSAPLEVTVNDLPTAIAIEVSGATTFCDGDSVILSAPAGFDAYEWSTGEITQSITIYQSGTYDYFVTNGNDCVSPNSSPLEITVNPSPQTPTVTTSGVTTFCDGDSVVLSAPSGFPEYEWSTGEITQSITVYDSGDYDVFVTNDNDCVSLNSQAINVTVNELPAVSDIEASGETTFCDGDSVTLSAPSGFDYEWSTGETTQSITVYESGTYEYFLRDANDCTSANTASLDITVNALPPIPQIVANGETTFCEGDSVTISAPEGFTYLWSTGEVTQEIRVSDEGSYDVTITNANGCSSASTSSAKIIVNPLPVAPIVQAIDSPFFCDGDSSTLVVAGGYEEYLWSTGENTQAITVFETGTFFCTVTDVNGCQNTSEPFNTTENEALPTPQITFSGNTEFCEGGSVTLFAPSGYFYFWSNGETTQDITLTETSGPLSCIIMDANGCMSDPSDTTFVEVFSLPSVPTIETSGLTTLCLGSTVELSAPEGFDSYMWSNGEITQSITVGQAGSYSVTVFNENNCSRQSITSVDVTVNPTPQQPTITVGGNTSFCEGESVTLGTSTNAPGYLWSNGDTTQSIVVTEAGSYFCVVLDEIGCQSQASVTIGTTVFDLPETPTITLSDDTILCPGDTVVLSAESGFEEYFWSNGTVNEEVFVTTDGEFSYFVVDGNGCESAPSDTVAVEVRPLPPPANIQTSNDFDFCVGDSIMLEADEGYLSYLWSTGDTARAIIVNNIDDFFYVADDGFSCEDAVSVTIRTDINLPPSISTITQPDVDTLCASEIADVYFWYRNDTLTNFNTQCITPDFSGDWQVVGVSDNCLSEISTAYDYTGRPPVDPNDPVGIKVFPNPAGDGFITIQTIKIPEDVVTLDIYDVLGRLLYQYELNLQQSPEYGITVNIDRLSAAVYVAVVDAGFSGRFVQKFVVED